MSHYRGFAIIPQATDALVFEALEPFRIPDDDPFGGDTYFDYAGPGGRYDGYLVSDQEMQTRKEAAGQGNDDAERRLDQVLRATKTEHNNYLVADLPADRRDVAFFICDGKWVDRDFTEDFDAKFAQALADHPDWYVVVIDAHG